MPSTHHCESNHCPFRMKRDKCRQLATNWSAEVVPDRGVAESILWMADWIFRGDRSYIRLWFIRWLKQDLPRLCALHHRTAVTLNRHKKIHVVLLSSISIFIFPNRGIISSYWFRGSIPCRMDLRSKANYLLLLFSC